MIKSLENILFKLVLIGGSLALCAAQNAQAGTTPDYYCDGGEVTINITRLSEDFQYTWMDFDGRQGELLTSRSAGSGASYSGNGYTFHTKGDSGSLTLPDGQNTDCVSVASFNQSRQNNNQTNDQESNTNGQQWPEIFVNGLSLGGKVRSGPGLNHEQTGSLAFKSPIVLLQNSGVQMDGFYWFKIQHSGGFVGYQWGGIMCSNELHVIGLYDPCPQ